MPPLPLQTIQQTGHFQSTPQSEAAQQTVRANPFCETEEVSHVNRAIQLASGDDRPAIRLKPIGAAIGLQPIGSPKIVRPSNSAMTIEQPPAALIQTNPLVGSAHHENGDLVETEIDASPVKSAASAPEHVHSTTDVSVAQPPMVISMVTPPIADSDESQPANETALQSIEFATVPQMDFDADQESTDVELVSDAEPIFFSFSDDSDALSSPTEMTVEEAEDANPETLDVVNDVVVNEAATIETETSLTESDALNSDASEVGNVELAMELPVPVSIDDPAGDKDSEVTLQPLSDVSVSPEELVELTERVPAQRRGPSINVAPSIDERAVQTHKPSKRYRPPVAVEAPPLGHERASAYQSSSMVQPASPPMLGGLHGNDQYGSMRGELSQPAGAAIPLYMTRAQVRSLTIGGNLRRVSIQDQNVCRAIASGTNELKLIGAGRGVTRLVVWADGASDDSSTVQHFDVHVQDAVEATGDSVGDKAEMLTRTIMKSFPDSRVRVKTVGDHLVISGSCTSEETATKILRMVRKTCLIPVHDELKVR
ncbi:pilus assembly protein N-terminal domain-containing protein [Novipirellula sp. SH528]|uniref:pilus assembly protein N-terminal domain-containing protein n=1 Tax=Novipirellula sp. SH528 TaxID=3454466 RepID=UPI003FA10E01